MEKQIFELTNSCTCANEDGCYTDDCFGCYEDDKSNVEYLLRDWATANNFDGDNQLVRIEGRGMTWQNRDGSTVIEFESIIDTLQINGDYRLTFTLDGENLTVSRGSHDEYGAFFKFTIVQRP